jgi:ferredoxin/flavodoxin---NADP+ reductase
VYDIPGSPAIRGKSLFENLKEQIAPYNIPTKLSEQVVYVSKNRNQIFRLECASGSVHHAKTVLLCLGMGAHVPRKLPLPNLAEYEGTGVHFGVHSLETFRNQRVLVVGGGDSALDMALTIVDECKDLCLLHRSDRFNAHEETVKKLYSSNAEIKTFREVIAVHGEGGVLRGVTLRDTRSGEEERIEVDKIILAIGLIFNLEGVKQWGITLDNNAIVVDEHRMTSVEGVYAAGDIATYPAKMKLIGTGAAEAMQAIHHAKHYIQEKFPYL